MKNVVTQTVANAWTEVFYQTRFLNNELWRWTALFGVLLMSFIAGRVVQYILARQVQKFEAGRLAVVAKLIRCLLGPVGLIILAGGLYLASTFMELNYLEVVREDGREITRTHTLLPFWLNVCETILVLAVGWFIYRLVDVVEFYLLRWAARSDTPLDNQLVPMIRKTLRVFVVIVVLLFIAQNVFAWDIGALVAGLGIGGLAFALAAKDMLSNLFGSVTIFADRPFQLGEFVKMHNQVGTVEEVGFRSTRLRLLNGALVTIPNAVVSNEAVENLGRRAFIRRDLNVTVTYDTPPHKIQQAMDIIKEMFEARKESFHPDSPPRVFFSDFNAASPNILVAYWFVPVDWWLFQAFNNDFNMELLRRFNEAGIEFAFPTQTLYLKGLAQESAAEGNFQG